MKVEDGIAATAKQANPIRSGLKLCSACKSEIPELARKCGVCQSFVDWRRFTGSTNLIAVVTLMAACFGIVSGFRELRKNEEKIDNVTSRVDDAFTELDRTREQLHTIVPSKERLEKLIHQFPFNETAKTSNEEAKLLMAFLKPLKLYSIGRGATSGSFGKPDANSSANYEVTIWINSYEKSDTYGVRFGLSDSTYWGVNESYFEVVKQGGGNVMINLNPLGK